MTWIRSILRLRETPVAVALILLVVLTTLANPRFLTAQSVKDLLLNATILMILAAGQTIVLLTRNVDLSVGSILGISGFLTGTLFAAMPEAPIPLVFLAGIAIGALLGAINGLLVTSAGVPSLVITLGTLYIYRGINNAWAGGKEYFSGDRPKAFGNLSIDTLLGFPIITLIAFAVIAVLAVALGFTRKGRDLYAIGSDPDAARLFGIPVGWRVLGAFAINGMLAGLAGVLYASAVQLGRCHDGHRDGAGRGGCGGGRWCRHLRRQWNGRRCRHRRVAADHHHQCPDGRSCGQVLATGGGRRADPRCDRHRSVGEGASGAEVESE